MEVVEENIGSVNVFRLDGRLDSNTAPEFEKRIFEYIQNGNDAMVLDFANLDYISSAGLRVILKASKNLQGQQGRIVICEMHDYVREVFEIAGFDTLFPIVPSLKEALQKFDPPR